MFDDDFCTLRRSTHIPIMAPTYSVGDIIVPERLRISLKFIQIINVCHIHLKHMAQNILQHHVVQEIVLDY